MSNKRELAAKKRAQEIIKHRKAFSAFLDSIYPAAWKKLKKK